MLDNLLNLNVRWVKTTNLADNDLDVGVNLTTLKINLYLEIVAKFIRIIQ